MKGVEYRIDPIVPFYGNEEFSKLSPLRRIPVLIDADVALCDSTVICEYLEERYPEPVLHPVEPAARARARWIEEYADSRMGEVFIWRYWNELVINRFAWGKEPDVSKVAVVLETEIPQVLDYLEKEIAEDERGFSCGFGLAEISVASFFRNTELIGFRVDADRWPGVADFVDRALRHDGFASLRRSFGTVPPRHGVFET